MRRCCWTSWDGVLSRQQVIAELGLGNHELAERRISKGGWPVPRSHADSS